MPRSFFLDQNPEPKSFRGRMQSAVGWYRVMLLAATVVVIPIAAIYDPRFLLHVGLVLWYAMSAVLAAGVVLYGTYLICVAPFFGSFRLDTVVKGAVILLSIFFAVPVLYMPLVYFGGMFELGEHLDLLLVVYGIYTFWGMDSWATELWAVWYILGAVLFAGVAFVMTAAFFYEEISFVVRKITSTIWGSK